MTKDFGNNFRVLLVDDEPDILEFIGYNLRKEGFEVETALNGVEAIEKVKTFEPHLVILDVMMPEMDGIETCGEIRRIAGMENVLIAFLTARGEDYSQIAGFEAGADDYITKPIKPMVLVSRVRALLKRYNPVSDERSRGEKEPIDLGALVIDREKYIVIMDGHELSLPRKEFELLSLLASKPGKVFERNEIYDSIWGDDVIVGDRTIDVHIRKLREKLGDHRIQTVKGVGYKLQVT